WAAQPRALDDPRDALRAAARAHRARLRARAGRRPHREERRPPSRPRARRAGLRLGAGGGGRVMTADALARAFDATGGDAERRAAFERFLAVGFPTTRLERWRYTDLKPIEQAELDFAPPPPDPRRLAAVRELLR